MKMSQYDNNNRGAIWANVKTKDTQPDFTGSILVDGKDYFLSGWKRKADANPKSPALSLAVTVKDNQPHTQAPQQSTQMAEAKAAMSEWDKGPSDGFGDDDIPF
jgi:hypothetical protein